jgi:hypothetical protein
MKSAFWLVVLVAIGAAVWIVARIRRTIRERERAEEARAASLLAGLVGTTAAPANPAPQPVRAAVNDDLAQQKLLFESAHKAGAAGEPALSIQLYARLLARYPATKFAEPAREAMLAAQKKLPAER